MGGAYLRAGIFLGSGRHARGVEVEEQLVADVVDPDDGPAANAPPVGRGRHLQGRQGELLIRRPDGRAWRRRPAEQRQRERTGRGRQAGAAPVLRRERQDQQTERRDEQPDPGGGAQQGRRIEERDAEDAARDVGRVGGDRAGVPVHPAPQPLAERVKDPRAGPEEDQGHAERVGDQHEAEVPPVLGGSRVQVGMPELRVRERRETLRHQLPDAEAERIADEQPDHEQGHDGGQEHDAAACAPATEPQPEEGGDEHAVLEVGEDAHLRAHPPHEQHLDEEDERGEEDDPPHRRWLAAPHARDRGRPSTRSARMLRWISDVPAKSDAAR